MWQKRLEKDKFLWPKTESEARQITRQQLEMRLSGIDFFRAHQHLNFLAVKFKSAINILIAA